MSFSTMSAENLLKIYAYEIFLLKNNKKFGIRIGQSQVNGHSLAFFSYEIADPSRVTSLVIGQNINNC